jgi:hypothetical protein
MTCLPLVHSAVRRGQADQRPCPWWKQVSLYAKQITACNLQFFVPYPGSIGLEYAQIILAQVNHLESPVNCRSLPANNNRARGKQPFLTQSQR